MALDAQQLKLATIQARLLGLTYYRAANNNCVLFFDDEYRLRLSVNHKGIWTGDELVFDKYHQSTALTNLLPLRRLVDRYGIT